MEETTNKSGMSTGMIIGIAVIVAIVFGGGAYAYVNSKAEKEKKDLNAQISDLQKQVAASATTATTTAPITTTTTDETANWKTYTSPTFGYSIKYPIAWTEKQGRVLETGVSEDTKNMSIEFYNSDTLMLRIATDYKTKVGDPSLATLAAEKEPPMDKTTISGAVAYKIGSLDGYRRLVVVSDPASHGLEYITKDSKYVYHMSTFANSESAEIVNMLKTFTAN
jgi:hypothetical protein